MREYYVLFVLEVYLFLLLIYKDFRTILNKNVDFFVPKKNLDFELLSKELLHTAKEEDKFLCKDYA